MNPLRRVYVRTSVSTHASMPVCVPGVALAAGDRRASPFVVPDSYIDFTASGIGTGVYVSCVCARARTGRQAAAASMRRNFLLATLRCLLLLQLRTHLLQTQNSTPERAAAIQATVRRQFGSRGRRGQGLVGAARGPPESCRSDSFRESSRASGACDAGSRKDEKAGSVQRAACVSGAESPPNSWSAPRSSS